MIIAFDFDGILCENTFPGIGKPNYDVVLFAKELIDAGHEVILWTSRAGNELSDAIEWCKDRGLRFCAVNDNAPSNKAKYNAKYPQGTRKVYADIYIDDHNPDFILVSGECGCYQALRQEILKVRRILECQEGN